MRLHGRRPIWFGGFAAVLSTIIAVTGWFWFRGNGRAVEPGTERGSPRGTVVNADVREPKQVRPAPPSRKEGRQVWAMLVGIEDYENSREFPSCPDAARDAVAMARWLIEEAKWDPGNVLLLTDQESKASAAFKDPARRPEHRQPTRRELARGVKEWLTPKVHRGDVVLIFFAGQAMSLPNQPGDRPGQAPRDYLVPWDARSGGIEGEGWRLGDAIEDLATNKDVSIVCLLDTSPAGRNRPPDRLGRQADVPPELRSRMLDGIVRWDRVTAWMAATEKPAGVRDGHGLLTRAFLATIGGRDDRRNLHGCLNRIRRDPALVGQGFRMVGGFGPELSLWPGEERPRLPRADPLLQRGHADRVTAVGFSIDGGRMFTASMDSTVRIWRDKDSLLLGVLPTTTSGFRSLAVSGDGRLLVGGGGKGDLLFYDLGRERFKTTERPIPHAGPVDRVAILHDGRHVVTLDNTGRALLWHAQTARDVALVRPVVDEENRETALDLSVASRRGASNAAFAALVKKKDGRQVLKLFDLEGKVLAEWNELPGSISAFSLSDEGERVIVGTGDGSVVELDRQGKPIRTPLKLAEEPINYLAFQPGWQVAGFGGTLQIIEVDKNHLGKKLELGEPIAREAGVAISVNGRRVAARGENEGRIRVWNVAADGESAEVLDLEQDKGRNKDVLSLAFSPGGETLVAGRAGGDIRSWRIPSGEPRDPIAANPGGGIAHIAVAPDETALLQVTRDGAAALWEFGELGNRGVWRIPGTFRAAGAFSEVLRGVVLITREEGRLEAYDRVTRDRRPLVFDQPTLPVGNGPFEAEFQALRKGNGRLKSEFDALSITRNGRWVAAVSEERSLACVWKIDFVPNRARLALQPIRHEKSGISNVIACSDDGRLMLTADAREGHAVVWNLGDAATIPGQPNAVAEAEPARVLAPKRNDPKVARPKQVTAAAFAPSKPGRVALGRKDGKIEVWQPGASDPLPMGELRGAVAAITFSPDGNYVLAAGDDREIRVRAIAHPEVPIQLGRWPNHYEKINALAFWPGGKLFLSGSDDATIRLWRWPVGDRSPLLGTLASFEDGSRSKGPLEWSVFTPDALFDASRAGQERVTCRLESEDLPASSETPVVRLDQLFQQRYIPDLAEILVKNAEIPESPALPVDTPPEISLESDSPSSPDDRRVHLRIRISKPGTTPRLYHNGVVVPVELKGDGKVYETTITLIGGDNRIYAMAGREGLKPDQPTAVDGRSTNELRFVHKGETLGRTHVLAIGVSKYKAQALRYAHQDAKAIAAFLKQNGIDGAGGAEPIVLIDEQVTRDAVDQAFEQLRPRVRPEDTLVVFLAGHTTIRQKLFCLLLPAADIPTGPDIVALRALIGDRAKVQTARTPINDPSVLPYFMIQRHLSMVAALRRLVIVDACEAEAIFDDPSLRALARTALGDQTEGDAQRYRTSYILATRRGEREPEPTELEHGLLTYVLLRGMGATNLRRPDGLKIFDQYPTADFNNDQWIDTSELQKYARYTVPSLAETFAGQPPRGVGPNAQPGPTGTKAAIANFDQSVMFRLIRVRGANP